MGYLVVTWMVMNDGECGDSLRHNYHQQMMGKPRCWPFGSAKQIQGLLNGVARDSREPTEAGGPECHRGKGAKHRWIRNGEVADGRYGRPSVFLQFPPCATYKHEPHLGRDVFSDGGGWPAQLRWPMPARSSWTSAATPLRRISAKRSLLSHRWLRTRIDQRLQRAASADAARSEWARS